MKEVDIKIKLPKVLTIHIPTFSDIELEDVFEVIAKEGKEMIYREIKDIVIDEFIKKHKQLIKSTAMNILKDKDGHLMRIIKEMLEKDFNN